VLHGSLQTLHFDHIKMHKLTLKIQEVIAFTKWLTDKQISAERASLESGLHSHLWTFGTIFYLDPNFMQIFTLVYHDIRNKLSFGNGD
jgi:hypothetical protein